MVEKGPRPAPEIQLVDKLIEKTVRIGELLENASVSGSVLHDVNQKLQTVDKKLDEMIQRESARVQGVVVFEAPKSKSKESQAKKKKPEKSRGLNDPRPIEFVFPSGDKVRGKEGKIIKFLSKAKNRTLNREQLSGEVYPGIRPKKAGELLNRSARSARKHAIRNGHDIVAKRDYERKTTNYSLVDRPKRKKKR